MNEPTRITKHQTVTTVRHVAAPFGRANTNPPSLGDFRAFVEACAGLGPDEAVSIEKGSLSESGRYNYTFSVRIVVDDMESA